MHQVFFHNGMTNNKDDYELCLRADNVELPKEGYFGVSGATGGLAGKLARYNLALYTFSAARSSAARSKNLSMLVAASICVCYE